MYVCMQHIIIYLFIYGTLVYICLLFGLCFKLITGIRVKVIHNNNNNNMVANNILELPS